MWDIELYFWKIEVNLFGVIEYRNEYKVSYKV